MRRAALRLSLAAAVAAGCGRGSRDETPAPQVPVPAAAGTVTPPPVSAAPPPRAAGPRRETIERVRPGMTREEVTRAVGGPPGDYVPDALKGYVLVNPRGVGYEGYDRWVTDEVELLVLFGPDGRAHDIRIWDVSVR